MGTYQSSAQTYISCMNRNHRDPEPMTNSSPFSLRQTTVGNILSSSSEDSRRMQWEALIAQSDDQFKKTHPCMFFLLPLMFPEITCQNILPTHRPLSDALLSQGIQAKTKHDLRQFIYLLWALVFSAAI